MGYLFPLQKELKICTLIPIFQPDEIQFTCWHYLSINLCVTLCGAYPRPCFYPNMKGLHLVYGHRQFWTPHRLVNQLDLRSRCLLPFILHPHISIMMDLKDTSPLIKPALIPLVLIPPPAGHTGLLPKKKNCLFGWLWSILGLKTRPSN